ncbi:MAG TPA: hypothetical protein VKA31_05155 [Mariprofundaceae bacterium]|nr:hypothetical protein [Mariprofundaceae bacterium]
MSVLASYSDIIFSILLLFGLMQLAWFSVMLHRRGLSGSVIQHTLPPMLAIWVLMWPVYVDSRWLWLGVGLFILLTLLARFLPQPFWKRLRLAWTPVTDDPTFENTSNLSPMFHFSLALLIAGVWFQSIPEFGFGLALSLCLAMPLAHWLDRMGHLILGFPAHPEQTLAGHVAFIITAALLLCWALHTYHGTPWQPLLIATLIAAMVGSASRAIIPGEWYRPFAMLSMGLTMWLL